MNCTIEKTPSDVEHEPVPAPSQEPPPSRAERFTEAAEALREEIEILRRAWPDHVFHINRLLEELLTIQKEYREQYEKLSLRDRKKPTGKKLQEILALDFDEVEEPDFEFLERIAEQAAELPEYIAEEGRDDELPL